MAKVFVIPLLFLQWRYIAAMSNGVMWYAVNNSVSDLAKSVTQSLPAVSEIVCAMQTVQAAWSSVYCYEDGICTISDLHVEYFIGSPMPSGTSCKTRLSAIAQTTTTSTTTPNTNETTSTTNRSTTTSATTPITTSTTNRSTTTSTTTPTTTSTTNTSTTTSATTPTTNTTSSTTVMTTTSTSTSATTTESTFLSTDGLFVSNGTTNEGNYSSQESICQIEGGVPAQLKTLDLIHYATDLLSDALMISSWIPLYGQFPTWDDGTPFNDTDASSEILIYIEHNKDCYQLYGTDLIQSYDCILEDQMNHSVICAYGDISD